MSPSLRPSLEIIHNLWRIVNRNIRQTKLGSGSLATYHPALDSDQVTKGVGLRSLHRNIKRFICSEEQTSQRNMMNE
jgi:argininosuccinate lyase